MFFGPTLVKSYKERQLVDSFMTHDASFVGPCKQLRCQDCGKEIQSNHAPALLSHQKFCPARSARMIREARARTAANSGSEVEVGSVPSFFERTEEMDLDELDDFTLEGEGFLFEPVAPMPFSLQQPQLAQEPLTSSTLDDEVISTVTEGNPPTATSNRPLPSANIVFIEVEDGDAGGRAEEQSCEPMPNAKPPKYCKDGKTVKTSGLKQGMHRTPYTLLFKLRVACDYEHFKDLRALGLLSNPLRRTAELYNGLAESNIFKWNQALDKLKKALTHETSGCRTQKNHVGHIICFSSKQARKYSLSMGRNQLKFGAAEAELVKEFKLKRAQGLKINERWICITMRRYILLHYGEEAVKSFKASYGWLLKFCSRNNLSWRRGTNNKHEDVSARLPRIKRWHARLRRCVSGSKNDRHQAKVCIPFGVDGYQRTALAWTKCHVTYERASEQPTVRRDRRASGSQAQKQTTESDFVRFKLQLVLRMVVPISLAEDSPRSVSYSEGKDSEFQTKRKTLGILIVESGSSKRHGQMQNIVSTMQWTRW